MSIQAAQFAATFDRLGRWMLAQLESLPEGLWDRAPLIHHRDSLLTLATRLLDESDHWVLVVVGGQEMGGERSLEASASDVRLCYSAMKAGSRRCTGYWVVSQMRS